MSINTSVFKVISMLLIVSGVTVGCSKQNSANEQNELSDKVKAAIEYKELDWDELIPESDRYDPNTMEQEDASIMRSFGFTSPEDVVDELNGQYIKLPGFIVPLEIQGNIVTEFLLVPYFGACIHTPPPPKNQLVYVKTKGFELKDSYLPVWVQGMVQIEDTHSELGSSGYLIESATISLYEEPLN